jgi:hypothetical protein
MIAYIYIKIPFSYVNHYIGTHDTVVRALSSSWFSVGRSPQILVIKSLQHNKVNSTIFGGTVNCNSIFFEFFFLLFHTHYMFRPLHAT